MTKSGLGKGLGRGFDTLIPQNFDATLLLDENERIQKISLAKLEATVDQPRQSFDETALAELTASIQNHGILQPLIVTKQGSSYRIIAGERRFRAAKAANLKSVPVIVRSIEELEELEIALVENVQRVDLSPLEQAHSIEKLHQQFSVSYGEISKRLGKANSTINNIVRLIQLPDDAKRALTEGTISEGHARSILALKDDPEQQAYLLRAITTNGWSVRQAERYVTGIKAGIKEEKAAKKRVATETPETEALSKRLVAPVSIRRTAKGGKLEIGFKTDEELARIVELLS